MISLEHRQHTVELVGEAVGSGARLHNACEEAGIAPCTYRRCQHRSTVVEDQRPIAKRPEPVNKLSSEERLSLLSVFYLPAFQSMPPSQVVPALADEGCILLQSRRANGYYMKQTSSMTEAEHASGRAVRSQPNTHPPARTRPGAGV
jgi:putative transposase